MDRRTFLQAGLAGLIGAGGIGSGWAQATPEAIPKRILWVNRAQTKEEGRVLYYQDQNLVQDGYYLLCYLLRDVQAEQITRMDLKLIDLLFAMQAWMRTCGIRQPLQIHSGYRTAQTHAHTEGAAPCSQHLSGKAVDLRVDGIPPAVLAKLAVRFKAGGVGVYPHFVHVDTGPVRVWKG
ncbi:MAG: DUF882 domain-containing protein [Gammaproteobacteria bacterium]|nr:DUF882 domain-containing protein [Gammaproteobacteria bacterium]MCP5458712.1 DUF882 domain-containing protein [Gammaproteobacteria bacterium]